MSAEDQLETCAALHDELLRQMYDEAGELPAELRAHLVTCATCRGALAASQRMSTALRAALRPEALSEQTVRTFQERLDAEPARRWLTRPHLVRLVGTAVAAGLVAALLLPWWWHRSGPRGPRGGAPAEFALSSEDAATILAAYACAGWEGTTEAAVSLLAEQVSGVSQAVQREAGAETLLPWTRENDWDLPAEDGGALRAPATVPHAGVGVA